MFLERIQGDICGHIHPHVIVYVGDTKNTSNKLLIVVVDRKIMSYFLGHHSREAPNNRRDLTSVVSHHDAPPT